MKKLRDFTQGDKLNALKTALVVVLLLGIAGSGFLGYSLYDSREENTLLASRRTRDRPAKHRRPAWQPRSTI